MHSPVDVGPLTSPDGGVTLADAYATTKVQVRAGAGTAAAAALGVPGLDGVAASLTQLVAWPAFEHAHTKTFPSLEQGLAQMGIHWYHPNRWTLGLILRYLRWQKQHPLFSLGNADEQNHEKKEDRYAIFFTSYHE